MLRARSKDVYYSGSYLERTDSVDWAAFQPIVSPGPGSVTGASNASGTGNDGSSVITDDDEASQMQQSAGAPRITIRYNDPGSLESVSLPDVSQSRAREREADPSTVPFAISRSTKRTCSSASTRTIRRSFASGSRRPFT